jgi:acyl-coenzyme A synthetase/AMP-(fatty) acid ligase
MHLQAMFNGCDQLQVATAFMVTEPFKFLELLHNYKIAYSFAPNFFMAAAIKPLAAPGIELPKYDLSNLKVLICGGEASSTDTLAMADQVLVQLGAPKHSIKSVYGLTEVLSYEIYILLRR